MKKILLKYIILIILTFVSSILIYNYVESFKKVDSETDILNSQKNIENKYFKNTNYTLDNPNIILNPYGNSPLSAVIIFQTKDLTTASVTIKGKDGADDLSHTFTPSKVHILPIYGLYPNYENRITVNASGKSKEVVIKTESLPENFNHVTTNDCEKNSNFYFTSSDDSKYMFAYDYKGNVRWYLTGEYKWDIQRLNNGHILVGNNKTVKNNYSISLTEMDLLGKIYFDYIIPGGYYNDALELNNGNILALSNNLDTNTYENFIVEIDRNTGDIIKKINLNKILKNNKKGNWFKASSLIYDINTNSITISGYNSNMLVNIDYSSLNINWIITDNKDNKLKNLELKNNDNSSYPTKPLSLNIINDNKIMFVNGGNNKKISTYEIDYSNRSFREIDSIKLNSNDDAYLISDSNNNYLITQNNNVTEVNNEDICKFNTSNKLYSTKKMSLYANDIYTGSYGTRLGSLGKSKETNDTLLLHSIKNNDILKKYNITLYKDVYGLKVSGNFKKEDKVKIILDSILNKKTYDLETGNYSSRYINEEGIKGKYYIYLKINGKTYKLYKYVNFY